MSLVNLTPGNWYEAKWPFPHPGYFKKHHDFQDAEGRYYLRVSDADTHALEIRSPTGSTAHWVAMPPRSSNYVNVGDRVRNVSTSQVHRVVSMAMDWMPRRRIAIVSLRVAG